jgi:hypothetical protein
MCNTPKSDYALYFYDSMNPDNPTEGFFEIVKSEFNELLEIHAMPDPNQVLLLGKIRKGK